MRSHGQNRAEVLDPNGQPRPTSLQPPTTTPPLSRKFWLLAAMPASSALARAAISKPNQHTRQQKSRTFPITTGIKACALAPLHALALS